MRSEYASMTHNAGCSNLFYKPNTILLLLYIENGWHMYKDLVRE